MSYDVWMEIDTGGPSPASVCESVNMTSNVSPMWRKALGFPLSDLEGVSGALAKASLREAIKSMEDDPEPYRAMNPSNGWGDHESALEYLRKILAMCVTHPKALIRISR